MYSSMAVRAGCYPLDARYANPKLFREVQIATRISTSQVEGIGRRQ